MTPRELDAALAAALGWTIEHGADGFWRLTMPNGADASHAGRVGYGWGDRDALIAHGGLPHYSTTSDGMLALIEAMRARGWHLELTSRDTRAGAWDCTIYAGLTRHMADGASMPLAVARCAAAALGLAVPVDGSVPTPAEVRVGTDPSMTTP